MKSKHFWQLIFVAGIILFLARPASADIVFTLLPSDGNISGPAGSTVGWGYSLTNTDPSNWFMSTDLNSDSFSNGTPTLLFDFPILAPGGAATETFDPVSSIGLFELLWDVSAPVGFVNSGNFTLSGQWWDGDPLNGGNFVANAPDIALAYSATVTSQTGAVPEPSSLVLLACGLGMMIAFRIARSRRGFRP